MAGESPTLDDRIAARRRPSGWPVMYQTWDKLIFLHWPVPVESIRRFIPERLAIDTFEGQAWIAVTPLTIYGLRPPLFPALPLLSQTNEINVRTYVHLDGNMPGVWFFSLDASNQLAVLGARVGFALPYFHADIHLKTDGRNANFISRRTHGSNAAFDAAWTLGGALPESQPGSLEFFLTERYCLYTRKGTRLYRARIHHRAWPLCQVQLHRLQSSMTEAQGLPAVNGTPVIHGQSQGFVVETWRPEKVS